MISFFLRAAMLLLLALSFHSTANAAATAILAPAEEQAAPEEEPAAPALPIEAQQDAGEDERIENRIGQIFRQIPSFENVDVSVSEGVVQLSGTVPKEEDIERAEALAAQVRGVATVENSIERDVSLESGISFVQQLNDAFRDFVKLLPLIALAIGVAAAIGFVGYLVAGFSSLWDRIAPNAFLAELIASAIRFAFIIGGIVVALDMIGAGALLGAILGGAGIIGIALGFALRETVENYIASLMLSLRQPFRANDHVLIEGFEGRIIRLTSRATILMTLDGNHVRIPNGQVFKAVITNFTRNPARRIEFDLGVDADDDITAARRLARDTIADLPYVLDDPPPEARIVEVGDSNVVIRVLGWIDQRETDLFKAKSRMIPAVKTVLEDAGFGLPEPIYRLRFDPRSAKLPLETFEAATSRDKTGRKDVEGSEDASASRPRQSRSSEEDHDVRPENEVARMVDEERAAAPNEKDLLDSGRPIE